MKRAATGTSFVVPEMKLVDKKAGDIITFVPLAEQKSTTTKKHSPGVGEKAGLSVPYVFTELASEVIDHNLGGRIHMGVEGVKRVLTPFMLGYHRSSV